VRSRCRTAWGPWSAIRSVRAEVLGRNMSLDLGNDLLAELESPVLLVLGVALYQEPLAVGVKPAVQLDDLAADREHPGDEVKIPDPKLGQLAPAEPASMAASTRSCASASGRAS
jgi:hypothetical protein